MGTREGLESRHPVRINRAVGFIVTQDDYFHVKSVKWNESAMKSKEIVVLGSDRSGTYWELISASVLKDGKVSFKVPKNKLNLITYVVALKLR